MRIRMLLLLWVCFAAPLLHAQDKGPAISRKVFIGADASTTWDALVNPKVASRYHREPLGALELKQDGAIWFGTAEKKVIEGKVLEVVAEKKLAYTFKYSQLKDAPSRVTLELEAMDAMCALRLTHDQFGAETETYKKVSGEWEAVLSNLKTLLETGDVLPWPDAAGPRAAADFTKSQFVELPSEEALPGYFEVFKFDATGGGEHGWGTEVERGEVALQRGFALSFRCDEKITRPQFALLKDIPRLARLTVYYCAQLNDTAFRAINGMVDLRELAISYSAVSDKGLRVSALGQLQSIEITACPGLTGTFIRQLPAPEKLLRFSMTYQEVSDLTLAAMAKCTSLRELRLPDGPQVTDEGLQHLKAMTELRLLLLPSRSAITDNGFAHLAAMTALERLSVAGLAGFTGQGFVHFEKLSSLRFIEVRDCSEVSSPAKDSFANLKFLEEAAFYECPKLDDRLLVALSRCKYLGSILLSGVPVTEEGIALLAGMTRLKLLHISSIDVSNAFLKSLAGLSALTQLALESCPGVTDDGVKELATMKNLTNLSLRGSESITDDSLKHIEGMASLTTLTLISCKSITKDAVEALRKAKPRLYIYHY